MAVVVSGSIAYDYIMDFAGEFTDHILPEQIHKLNISFVIDKLQRYYGGCAPNIAYSMALLGQKVSIVGTAGRDFDDYQKHLQHFPEISAKGIVIRHDEVTACAYINSDLNSNQITAYYPGASKYLYKTAKPDKKIKYAIVGPENKLMMLNNLQSFTEADIPVIFDSGQMTPYFDNNEWAGIFASIKTLILNDYEMELVQRNSGKSLNDVLKTVDTVIVTKGAMGSTVYAGKKVYEISVATPQEVLDPTGAGDAYRAGLVLGLVNDADWETSARLGAVSAVYALESRGTQCHRYSLPEFFTRFRQNFGYNVEF